MQSCRDIHTHKAITPTTWGQGPQKRSFNKLASTPVCCRPSGSVAFSHSPYSRTSVCGVVRAHAGRGQAHSINQPRRRRPSGSAASGRSPYSKTSAHRQKADWLEQIGLEQAQDAALRDLRPLAALLTRGHLCVIMRPESTIGIRQRFAWPSSVVSS